MIHTCTCAILPIMPLARTTRVGRPGLSLRSPGDRPGRGFEDSARPPLVDRLKHHRSLFLWLKSKPPPLAYTWAYLGVERLGGGRRGTRTTLHFLAGADMKFILTFELNPTTRDKAITRFL